MIKMHKNGCPAIDDHHVTDGTTFERCTCNDPPEFILAKEEVEALVRELDKHWFDHHNPLAQSAFNRMQNYINELAKRDSSTT